MRSAAVVVPEAAAFVCGAIAAAITIVIFIFRSEHTSVVICETVGGVAAVTTHVQSIASGFVVNDERAVICNV